MSASSVSIDRSKGHLRNRSSQFQFKPRPERQKFHGSTVSDAYEEAEKLKSFKFPGPECSPVLSLGSRRPPFGFPHHDEKYHLYLPTPPQTSTTESEDDYYVDGTSYHDYDAPPSYHDSYSSHPSSYDSNADSRILQLVSIESARSSLSLDSPSPITPASSTRWPSHIWSPSRRSASIDLAGASLPTHFSHSYCDKFGSTRTLHGGYYISQYNLYSNSFSNRVRRVVGRAMVRRPLPPGIIRLLRLVSWIAMVVLLMWVAVKGY